MESVLSILFSGFFIGVFISAPMGPIGMLVIQRTLNKGRTSALCTGVGASISDLIYCLLTGMGLSFITDFITSNQNTLQVVGSLVLIVYGIYLFRSNPSRALKPPTNNNNTYWRDFGTGFLFTFSNPLILFFIIGLFARFNFMDTEYQIYHYFFGYLSIAAGALCWWIVITYFVNKVRAHFNVRSMWLINRIIASILLIMAMVGFIHGTYNLLTMHNSNLTLNVPCITELDSASADEIIKILDEHGARRTVDQLNWKEQYPYRPLTAVSIAHSGTAIYIDFMVRCNYLRAVNYQNNSSVHQDSCVEFFVCPDGKLPYYNFEFNCIGTIHAACRQDRHNGTPLTDAQLDRVRRFPSCGTRPFEELEGMFTWNLLVAIPLDLIGLKYEGEPIAMKGNFYKCADLTTTPHFLSWAPINTPEPDFHRPEFFADIILD